MKRRILVLVPLFSAVVLAACAESPYSPQSAAPTETLVPGGNVSVDTRGGLAADEVDADAGSGDEVLDAGLVGLSERTTRGHVWADPSVNGDLVAIPIAVATLGDHVHFEVDSDGGAIGFVGYFTEGAFFVRADVCPACGAQAIEWGGSLVVCRACGATFDAVTGEADGESCGYPAGTLPYRVAADAVTMSLSDLVAAHARTVAGEETLFEMPETVEVEDRGDASWPRCCRT